MLTTKKLTSMLVLQDRLNSVVNPNWPEAGYDWRRAMMHEAVEMQGHLGWKWWKKQEPDVMQAKIELVDIWHFMLSFFIEEASRAPGVENLDADQFFDLAAGFIEKSANGDENTQVLPHPLRSFSDLKTTNEKIDAFVGLVAFDYGYVFAFEILMKEVGLTWQELERLYVGKNVLNLFRQANGYKVGTYIKDWAGEEDNVVLEKLMDLMPEATAADLYAALQLRYESLGAPVGP